MFRKCLILEYKCKARLTKDPVELNRRMEGGKNNLLMVYKVIMHLENSKIK
jgi:hypothetical protein